ncbi:MAG: heterodisulfide reductase-related iron-sulfur binding cluster [Deltaproteobacteria bacterium]|nr:heterodisulfide reductase-related iron-sulfur binding cluster [Deltaproteobacteria bacterium]
MTIENATREIMWNIGPAWLMYGLAAAAVAVFAYGVWRRVRYWRRGRPADERLGDAGRRALVTFKELLLQKRAREERFPGVFHSLVFYSFLLLAVTTGVVALDYDFGTRLFRGPLYALLSLGADLGGALILVGAGMALWRRLVKRPKTIENTAGDFVALALLGLMALTGFLVEGLRMATAGDAWPWLSPVGYAFSALFTNVSIAAGEKAHAVLWWTHTLFALGWIASIPYTKFLHLITTPANVYFGKLTPRGALARDDLDKMMEAPDFDEAAFRFGTEAPKDFTWKELLDFDACVSCGRCEEVCPSTLAGQPFSPKQMIARLKALAHESLNGGNVGNGGAETPIIGHAFDDKFLWYCRTCTACMEVCPAMIDHVDTVINIRRNEAVMQGRLPADLARALRMLETQGNPFGPEDVRSNWIGDLGVRIVAPGESVDVLYWIGCCMTFDPSKQKIASDLCRIMDLCGIDFGVLGADERCCGDPARVAGQEHLFQAIAKAQVDDLNKRQFRILMVSCPHCYNVLANEYPQFGGKYTVVHHTEFLHEMMWSGSLVPRQGEKRRVVYHDPCYLGRYQKIYDSPREVLRAVPGTDLVEMKHHQERSLCCGGGGGNYWFDVHEGERLNNRRIEQARDAHADLIVTGCAYCKQMLEDSAKLMDLEDVRVADLATVVLESL